MEVDLDAAEGIEGGMKRVKMRDLDSVLRSEGDMFSMVLMKCLIGIKKNPKIFMKIFGSFFGFSLTQSSISVLDCLFHLHGLLFTSTRPPVFYPKI